MNNTEFEAFFGEYYQMALFYTKKKIQDTYAAEDITMDAFFSCYKNKDRFDPNRASFATWLFVALNNRIKNYYRDAKITDDLSETIADGDSFEDEILQAEYLGEMREHLRRALLSLTETQREIVICKYFRNMDAKEIAERMGLGHGNVRIQLMRALAHMRDYFDKNNIRWEM